MASYLITGCSRGLGLAMATHLLTLLPLEVSTIFATARTESPALKHLTEKSRGRVVFVHLDATNTSSVKDAVTAVEKSLGGKGLDVLINNAGKQAFVSDGIVFNVMIDKYRNDLEDHFTANVQSVHLVTRAFIPLLQNGSLKKVANISTTMGSISKAANYAIAPSPAYKVSKAALNMLTVRYPLSYAEQGFTIFVISPGWLRTELGGSMADLSVEEGAKATLDRIMNAGKEENGKFLNIRVKGWEKKEGLNQYDGGNPPW